MPDNAKSANADGKHIHTPESGDVSDSALSPGASSGSGDVEHTQRLDILRRMSPEDLTADQKAELEAAEFVRSDRHGETRDAQDSPTTHLDEDAAHRPAGASKDQHDLVTERNQELLDGAEAGPDGERKVGVGRTVSSDPSQTSGAPA